MENEKVKGLIEGKNVVKVIAVPGKSVGDKVEFGGLLGYAPIIAVNTFKPDTFIHRGGRIPAPVRSLTN